MKKYRLIFFIIILGTTCYSCKSGSKSETGTQKQPVITEKNDTIVINEVIDPIDTFSYSGYNSIARILAGKYPEDTTFMSALTNGDKFKKHHEELDKIWDEYSTELVNISDWVENNLGKDIDTVFYPFSGPDFNYLNAFFPNSKFSVLIGLEKAGSIPFANVNKDSIEQMTKTLEMVSKTINTNLKFSFFRTLSMKNDLNNVLHGTLPIIMMFMSRHDYQIVNINPVHINDRGFFEYTKKEEEFSCKLDKSFKDSYEIIYKKNGENDYRKLYYVSMDLSNYAIDENLFNLMMDNYFKDQTTFLKAASYLMFKDYFSIVKESILDNSDLIVTGVSGIPYKDFDSTWTVNLYGNYVGPINLFKEREQKDLKKAFQSGNIEKIPFRFDYDHINSSIIIARKH